MSPWLPCKVCRGTGVRKVPDPKIEVPCNNCKGTGKVWVASR